MGKYNFILSGTYNKRNIKTKKFKSLEDAKNTLDSILLDKDLEVSYILRDSNTETYVVNNYSRFVLERL